MSNLKKGLASLNVKSVSTKKSLTLRQRAKQLAKTDFWAAFNMVHNSHMMTSVGIVGVNINGKKKKDNNK